MGPDGRQLISMKASDFEMQAVDGDTSLGISGRKSAAPVRDDAHGGRTPPFTVVLNWAAALRK
jgi:hypothetical protein